MTAGVPIQLVAACGVGPSTRAPGMAEWIKRAAPGPVDATGQATTVAEHVALAFICPCGCGSFGVLHVIDLPGHRKYAWDGSEATPTIHTPIVATACAWSGTLDAGTWNTAQ